LHNAHIVIPNGSHCHSQLDRESIPESTESRARSPNGPYNSKRVAQNFSLALLSFPTVHNVISAKAGIHEAALHLWEDTRRGD